MTTWRLLFLALLLFLATSSVQAGVVSSRPLEQGFVPEEIIVQFKAEALPMALTPGVRTTGLPSIDALNSEFRARGIFPLFANPPQRDSEGLGRIYLIRLAPGSDVLAAVQKYASDPNVEFAEPNYLAHITLIPNDTRFSEQWALPKIQAPQAWDTETGEPTGPEDARVVIAIIDTGIDFEHPDLAGQIWTNTNEVPGNILDDDGNGYVDDVNGWDFVNNDNNPDDDNIYSHGSHVSGIAAAALNNATGIAGICPGCRIMPLKVCGTGTSCSVADIVEAIYYAADNGAKIISMSLGGPCSPTEAAAVNYAWNKDLLIIAASGNGGNTKID